MRSSTLIATVASVASVAYAQENSTTVAYTNGFTSFLTETNSLGVVTGQPSVVTTQPAAITTQATLPAGVTSQPAVATIPAGLPVGLTSIYQNASGSAGYFVVSVGESTTVALPGSTSAVTYPAANGTTVVGGSAGGSTGSLSTMASGSASATGSESAASGTSSGTGAATGSSSAAASSSSAASAASNVQVASAGLLGLGAFIVAFL